MTPASVNWVVISALATAAGTLVLAVATFASVRSANHAARVAERSFRIALRPILAPSRLEDPDQRIMYADRHWVSIGGGQAAVESADGVVYLAMQVRNVGNGVAMIAGWQPYGERLLSTDAWPAIGTFRPQGRSLWIPPGDVAFWQGALRDEATDLQRSIAGAVAEGELGIDLLYRDHEGKQPTISRFTLVRDEDGVRWWVTLGSHHAPSGSPSSAWQ
ncbi:MAG: hypothetical protein ACRDYE_01665 [Acidimicrobiales bacterium]